MMDTFDNRTKIIWYQIENLDLKTEVLVFSKINMGKIPLTNAELIKALLLKKDKNDNEKKVGRFQSDETCPLSMCAF